MPDKLLTPDPSIIKTYDGDKTVNVLYRNGHVIVHDTSICWEKFDPARYLISHEGHRLPYEVIFPTLEGARGVADYVASIPELADIPAPSPESLTIALNGKSVPRRVLKAARRYIDLVDMLEQLRDVGLIQTPRQAGMRVREDLAIKSEIIVAKSETPATPTSGASRHRRKGPTNQL